MHFALKVATVLAFAGLAGCSPMGAPSSSSGIISQSLNHSACTDYSVYDPIIAALQSKMQFDSPEEFKREVVKQVQLQKSEAQPIAAQLYSNDLSEIYQEIYLLIQPLIEDGKFDEAIKVISEIETGFPSFKTVKEKLKISSQNLSVSAQQLGLNCKKLNVPLPAKIDLFDELKKLAHPAVYGAHKVTATSYQSCQTLDLDPLTSQSPNVRGIVITGMHPNGVGQMREVGDLNQLINSHYYIAGIQKAQSTCADLKLNPLIYDYGGKPFATTGTNGTLDVFKDSGSGTTALGIDCSGYVFSAFASAGLRMAPNEPLKAQNVYGINSARFKTAPDSGLSCFSYADVDKQKSLIAGDVVASDGHVFLVDWVGEDPLGVNSIASIADCRLGPISASKFDFVLSQSAPVKSGIGINRMLASSYLTSGEMKAGLEQFAIRACLAKFNNVQETPALTDIGIIRHKRSQECLAPEIVLEKQECLSVCSL